MVEQEVVHVPVWTLATHDAPIPAISDSAILTPARLAELRGVLAALSEAPIATLEAHPVPESVDTNQGLRLSSASPLATHLSQVVDSMTTIGASSNVTSSGEVLYKMVLPAKVAAQVGNGLLHPMKSQLGGVHSALVGQSRIAAHASFVPAAGAAAGIGALTIAGPLMVAAAAACASAHAEHQRHQALERITELLEKLHLDQLDNERNQLDGCRSSIGKASAILLDRGVIGEALGLGPAVHTIETAASSAKRRVKRWTKALDELPQGRVELDKLRRLFAGIDDTDGEFHAHVELARVAIAMKRRVIVLQAVEQAQLNPDNTFERFIQVLGQDQVEVDGLEAQLDNVLLSLSRLHLDRSHGIRDFVFSSAEVDVLLKASRNIRALGDGISEHSSRNSDVAIEMVREKDGSVVVFPAMAAA